jgi:thiamine phosphate synthase YjbQ (UPF0047 family)
MTGGRSGGLGAARASEKRAAEGRRERPYLDGMDATEDDAMRRFAAARAVPAPTGAPAVEIPYAIAAALPTLSVMDITNEVSKEVAASGRSDGIAYIRAGHELALVRVQERETGFFEDLESLLERVVPATASSRERLLAMVLGSRGEQVPFSGGALCLGRWQRVMLFSLDGGHRADWQLTLIG